MKRSRAWPRWFVLSSLFILSFPAGSAQSPAAARGTPVPTRPTTPAGLPPLPLKGPMTLDSGTMPAVGPPKVDYSAVHQDLKALANALSNYSQQLSIMTSKVADCRKHEYSVQEQESAGCKGTDSVDQCREKLLLRCMNTGVGALVTKDYRPTAKKLLEDMPKMMDRLKKAESRVKYEADRYDFD